MSILLTFDDQGQDFLRWTLNERGVVIECAPFQNWVWRGARVLDFENLAEGDTVNIAHNGKVLTIKYPLIGVYSWNEWCRSMDRPRKDCGCPDCGRCIVDYAGE